VAESIEEVNQSRRHGRRSLRADAGWERTFAVNLGVADGIELLYVAELVRVAIENTFLTVMLDTEHDSQVEARLAAIKREFDRVRGGTLQY